MIDRFEGRWAVLLIDGQTQAVNLLRSDLPNDAEEGDHVQVEFSEGKVASVQIDETAKQDAIARIKAKLDRLRRGDHLVDTE